MPEYIKLEFIKVGSIVLLNFLTSEVLRGHSSIMQHFFLEIVPLPTPRNTYHVEPYTFITLFSGKFDILLHYIMLELPLIPRVCAIVLDSRYGSFHIGSRNVLAFS